MSRIAQTPEPPYFAVIAPAVLRPKVAGYAEAAARLLAIAPAQPGFLGIEACVEDGFAMAVSYWRSLDAIETWRSHARHLAAKQAARTRWFDAYITRIAQVQRVY